MIEIWGECARFQTISQNLADQVSTIIIKNVWFSDLEILEMYQQINREPSQQDQDTIIDTLNTENKSPLIEMNHKAITIEIQHNTNTNTRRKNEYRDYKGNYVWKEDDITIAKKPRLENGQGRK